MVGWWGMNKGNTYLHLLLFDIKYFLALQRVRWGRRNWWRKNVKIWSSKLESTPSLKLQFEFQLWELPFFIFAIFVNPHDLLSSIILVIFFIQIFIYARLEENWWHLSNDKENDKIKFWNFFLYTKIHICRIAQQYVFSIENK